MQPTKVFVYFNLHKKCFSVKALEGSMKGRVIAHRHQVFLYDATFKVSEAGRQRVLREKRKNVHAGVCGTWDERDYDNISIDQTIVLGQAVMYNPYKYDSFVTLYGEAPVIVSRLAALNVANNKPSIHITS
jgi:hypothetical protein